MPFSCLVVDDEPIARQIVETYIAQTPQLEHQQSCEDAIEAMDYLHQNEVDIMFLDINMPGMSGLGLLKSLQQIPQVIITSAYEEYALEGFDLEVCDYLLKPFSFERFVKASNRAISRLGEKAEEITAEHIFVKSDKKIIKVNFDDLVYVEAYGNYLKLHTNKGMILTPQTMTAFLKKLPQEQFYRIQKSFVISIKHLEGVDGHTAILGEYKVPIGKIYRQAFIEHLGVR